MTAIRAKRRKVAEYLIDQLGINVNHTTDLLEFRLNTKIPVRERTLSCRDLAYEKGLMDLVDLIDIASDEVKPSVKRYLQRRLKNRLDEIHQAYLKRMKERSHRLIIQTQQRENEVFEEEEPEQGKETDEVSNVNTADDTSLPPPALPPPPPIIHRPYKSHIEETIQTFESKNDKSIEETGKKRFQFSGYTLRYRLVETNNTTPPIPSEPKSYSFPTFPTTPTPARVLPRPQTAATNMNRRSLSEISTRIPIRETRTSICRSARRLTAPRISSSINPEIKPDIRPSTASSTQRLLPKRVLQFNTNYNYVPQIQNTVYNESCRFMPVTLKSTAIGLPSGARLIRD